MRVTPNARSPIMAPNATAPSSSQIELDPAGVEERDHEDRADVVDDGQREQEELQRLAVYGD